MVFSSLLFLFRFLPAVLILYYIAPRKLRNVILLLFSLFFYAWGEPKYVFLMLFTITMDFFIGKGIDKAKKEGNQKKAKRFLMISILVDLSIPTASGKLSRPPAAFPPPPAAHYPRRSSIAGYTPLSGPPHKYKPHWRWCGNPQQ